MSVPPLAVPPELAELLSADAHTFASTLGPAFDAGRFGAAHRAVLVNLLARCRPEVLDDAATALAAVDPMSPSAGLALALADLARTRSRMLVEIGEAGVVERSGRNEVRRARRGTLDLGQEPRPRRLVLEQEVVGALQR